MHSMSGTTLTAVGKGAVGAVVAGLWVAAGVQGLYTGAWVD